MARKLVFALSLAAVIGLAAGCKEDTNTSMKFDAKNAYQQSQDKYNKEKGSTATTTTNP